MKTLLRRWYYLLILVPYGIKCLTDCEIISSFKLNSYETLNFTLIMLMLIVIAEIISLRVNTLKHKDSAKK